MSQLADDSPSADLRDIHESAKKIQGPIQSLIDIIVESGIDIYEIFISIEDFQLQLLRLFLLILCFVVFCIWFAWRKYGSRITERFMRPGSNRILDDLRTEAIQLKLPKEHTPRI